MILPVCAGRLGGGFSAALSREFIRTGTTPNMGGMSDKNSVQFAVCIHDGGNIDLQKRKLYQVLLDPVAAKHKQVRVIDDSGEDYLYPEPWFVLISLPEDAERAVLAAESPPAQSA